MTSTRKTGYVVAKRASTAGKLGDVFATLPSRGGVTRVMDADTYRRAAKRAASVLRSNADSAGFAVTSALVSSRKT